MKLLLPKDKAFFNYLTSSNNNLKNITEVLVEATISYKNFPSFGKKAEKIEHDADQNVHEIIRWLNRHFEIPLWVVLAAHASIALGTMTGGWRIVKTMGQKITRLRPIARRV